MATNHSGKRRNAVLLIDIENLVGGGGTRRPIDIVELVQGIRSHYADWVSEFAVARAYANWIEAYHRPVRQRLHRADIDPIQIFRFSGAAENAADAEMIVDAISIAYERPELDVFVLATADGAFTAPATKLHELGRTVLGVCCSDPNEYLVEACDLFAFYDHHTNHFRRVEGVGPSFERTRSTVGPGTQADPVVPAALVALAPARSQAGLTAASLLEALASVVRRVADETGGGDGQRRLLPYQEIAAALIAAAGVPWKTAATEAGMVGRKSAPLRLSGVLGYLVPTATMTPRGLLLPPEWVPEEPAVEPPYLPDEVVGRLVEDLAAATIAKPGFADRLRLAVGASQGTPVPEIAEEAARRLEAMGLCVDAAAIEKVCGIPLAQEVQPADHVDAPASGPVA